MPVVAEHRVRCTHCDAWVAIPPDYHELYRASHRSTETQHDAAALLRQLGPEPGIVRRLLGNDVFVILVLVGGGAVGLPLVLPGSLNRVMMDVHPRLGLHEFFTAAPRSILFAGTAFLVMAVPAVLSAYAGSATFLRRALELVLAARPPLHDGGPVGCRACGAALEAHPDAALVRCIYCGVESSVRAAGATRQRFMRRLAGDIALVDGTHEQLRVRRRALAGALVFRLSWLLACCAFFAIWYYAHHRHKDAYHFRTRLSEAWCLQDSDVYPHFEEGRLILGRPISDCGPDCIARLHIPLVAGRMLRIALATPTEDELDAMLSRFELEGTLPIAPVSLLIEPGEDGRQEQAFDEEGIVLPAERTFVPPHSGWYEVLVFGNSFVRLELSGAACTHTELPLVPPTRAVP